MGHTTGSAFCPVNVKQLAGGMLVGEKIMVPLGLVIWIEGLVARSSDGRVVDGVFATNRVSSSTNSKLPMPVLGTVDVTMIVELGIEIAIEDVTEPVLEAEELGATPV